MEAISREFRVALPWELLYADDLALAVIAETEEELTEHQKPFCTPTRQIPPWHRLCNNLQNTELEME